MKKILYTALVAAIPAIAAAQSAIDAFSVSQSDMRGTARYMSMAGAFTALGGDLSAITRNPGGIGIYRYSELGATLDIDFQRATMNGMLSTQTTASCSNFGYVGSTYTGVPDVMPYFNWGVSYGRVASFDRRYRGSTQAAGSLTNYVADYTANEAWTTSELNGWNSGYDPYYQTYAPWMSILMYNSYGINPSSDSSTDYAGLYNGSSANQAYAMVEERGYVDEYNITFGGNVKDMVYWGMGFGITDISYTNSTYYSESFTSACIASADALSRTTGSASLGLDSWKHIWGSGWNFKIGFIVKPVNEFRIGFSFTTPTYYNMRYSSQAQTGYSYGYSNMVATLSGSYPSGNLYDAAETFDFKMRTPWDIQVGVAGVIGGKAIASLDYQYKPYDSMKVQDQYGYEYINETSDCKYYYRGQNTVRLGLEYRLTPHVSARAGYSYQSSPTEVSTAAGYDQVYTAGPGDTGTMPSYTMERRTNYLTCGLGYRYKNFYADAAYVHRTRSSTFQAYTNYRDSYNNWVDTAPRMSLSEHDSRLVISAGFKF